MIASLVADVRYALRQLRRTPGFTVTALLTLALGIGANSAIFTLVNAVLLKDLPVADPRTLIRLGDNNDCCVGDGTDRDGDTSLFSTDSWQQLKKNAPEFEELAAMQAGFTYRPVTVRHEGSQSQARSVMGEFVSGNYFRTFGLRPEAGRLFTGGDDTPQAPMVAVMSYTTWKNEYSASPDVIGRTVWVNTKPVTVVGVAPQGYFGDRMISTPPDYYLPIETMPVLANVPYVHAPGTHWLYMIGRVKPGVALGPLQAKLSGLLRQIYSTNERFSGPDGRELLAKVHIVLTPAGAGIQAMQEGYASHLHLLMWVSGVVLLIACANIANLLLVRGMARKSEMSVRTALGAARSRVIRQLLTESVVLAGLGGMLGLFVAWLGTRMLIALAFPGAQQVPIDPSPSGTVLGFAFGLSLLTGVLFGVAPAWITAQADPVDALRGSRTTVGGTSLLQRGLVVVQAALSLVLLVGAALFSQSLSRLENTDMKLDATNRYIVHINPQAAGYSQRQLETLYRTVEDRFHALPGVSKVGITTYTPMEDNNNGYGVFVEGKPGIDLDGRTSVLRINGDYFDSVGTKVLKGRGISERDTSTAPPVVVVNESFVKRVFGKNENPIGRRIGFGGENGSGDFEIVGVVEDTAYQTVRWKDHRMVFIPLMRIAPHDQTPIENNDSLYASAIVVETQKPIGNMEALTRQTLSGINPNLTVVKFQTFAAQISDQFIDERLLARLTMLFGGLALLLAAVGLYGVTAYNVVRRTPEIGIRMALGAERGGVVRMVLRGALLQTLLGMAIGVPVALFCVRFIKAQLYEIAGANAAVMAIAVLTLMAAACFAALIPAKRAASIDPQQALRHE